MKETVILIVVSVLVTFSKGLEKRVEGVNVIQTTAIYLEES